MEFLNEVIRTQLRKNRTQLIDSYILNKTIALQVPGFTLIKAEPYSGATALCIRFAEFLSINNLVIYVDINNNLTDLRVKNVNSDNFIVIRPTEHQQIVDLANSINEELKDTEENVIFILDSAYLLKSGIQLDSLALTIKAVNRSFSIIATCRPNYKYRKHWTEVIRLKLLDNIYYQRELLGHKVSILGSLDSSEHYVSHTSGLLSNGYEYAKEKIDLGELNNSSEFSYMFIHKKGIWNFINSCLAYGI
jgi:hypothetical protein